MILSIWLDCDWIARSKEFTSKMHVIYIVFLLTSHFIWFSSNQNNVYLIFINYTSMLKAYRVLHYFLSKFLWQCSWLVYYKHTPVQNHFSGPYRVVKTWISSRWPYLQSLISIGWTVFQNLTLFHFWCFNAIFSNISAISWRPVLVVEEAGVPGENHRPWASNL